MVVDTSGLELGKVSEEVSKGAQFAYAESEKKKAVKAKQHILIRNKGTIIGVAALIGGSLIIYHFAKKIGKGVEGFADSLNPANILKDIGDQALKPFTAFQGSFDIEKMQNSLMKIVPTQNLFDLGEKFILNPPTVFKSELDGIAPNPLINLPQVNVDLKSIFAETDFFNVFHQETGEKATDLGLTKKWIF